jgi:RimJ/RimL family protein N-acetyltransferase
MLHGERVVLRAIRREDLPNYVAWFNDPDVLEYFGHYRPMSLPQEERWYETMLQDRNVLSFAIEVEGRHVGACGFPNIDHQNRCAEVGLFIGVKELWGQGLCADVLRTLLRYGFEQLNFHRIYLRLFAENERGRRCYERVGFQVEGRFREHTFRHGRWIDELRMGILEDEWRAQSSG